MLERLRPLGLGVLVLTTASLAHAKPPPKRAKLELPAQRLSPTGKSIGSPTEGHLIGGARLSDAPYIRIVPVYAAGDVRWGVEPLVGAIERSARAVKKQFSDAVLSVGHLSRKGGGALDRHASHESGRDADIAFYVKNVQGKPVYADHFVPFKGDGTAPTWPGAHFDDAKNWAFVASMVGDARARVTHIFVSTPIRQRLLAYAQKIGAPASLRVRASALMAQPRGALPHDDHFHIRVACPPGMNKCIEVPMARHHRKPPHPSAMAKASPPRSAPSKEPQAHENASSPPAKSEEADETADSMPSLGPIVPGLDSVVIPKPLEDVKPPAVALPALPSPASPPEAPAVDDPDGVYDQGR